MAVAPAQVETLFIAKVDTKWKFVGMGPHCCIDSFPEFWTRKTSLQFQTLVLHRSILPETPGHEAAVELQYKSFIARNSTFSSKCLTLLNSRLAALSPSRKTISRGSYHAAIHTRLGIAISTPYLTSGRHRDRSICPHSSGHQCL